MYIIANEKGGKNITEGLKHLYGCIIIDSDAEYYATIKLINFVFYI
jgi:hypothetical protein